MGRGQAQEKVWMAWPGVASWECWERAGDGHWHRVSCLEKLDGAEWRWERVGVPSSGLVWMPMGLVGEASLFNDMARAHLERAGLLAEGGGCQALCVRVLAEQPQGHVGVAVLWPDGPAPAWGEPVSRHFVPAACGKEPGDADVFLWCELGEWVVGFFRLAQPLYVKGLGSAPDPESCAADILCETVQLHGVGWLDWPKKVGVEGAAGEPLARAVAQRLSATLHVHEHRPPRHVENPWDITPLRVLELRARQAKRRNLRRGMVLAAIVLLLLLAAATAHRAAIEWQSLQVRRELEKGASRVAELRDIALRWEALEPTFDTSRYPLEILRSCVAALPKDGARLNLFQVEDRRILVRGEARGAKDAFAFADALKKNDALKYITWQMPQPKLLPNDTAQFQLEGTW